MYRHVACQPRRQQTVARPIESLLGRPARNGATYTRSFKNDHLIGQVTHFDFGVGLGATASTSVSVSRCHARHIEFRLGHAGGWMSEASRSAASHGHVESHDGAGLRVQRVGIQAIGFATQRNPFALTSRPMTLLGESFSLLRHALGIETQFHSGPTIRGSPSPRIARPSAVAKLSGVPPRALHHYDEIGLLSPARGKADDRVGSSTDLLLPQ